mmetsp:Transcript_87085/g.174223  ORF Transcript_87085/g.174223 Transcript_87085/m.174223 type:complete len:319 (-) Transcript_87085:1321-2277(-)
MRRSASCCQPDASRLKSPSSCPTAMRFVLQTLRAVSFWLSAALVAPSFSSCPRARNASFSASETRDESVCWASLSTKTCCFNRARSAETLSTLSTNRALSSSAEAASIEAAIAWSARLLSTSGSGEGGSEGCLEVRRFCISSSATLRRPDSANTLFNFSSNSDAFPSASTTLSSSPLRCARIAAKSFPFRWASSLASASAVRSWSTSSSKATPREASSWKALSCTLRRDTCCSREATRGVCDEDDDCGDDWDKLFASRTAAASRESSVALTLQAAHSSRLCCIAICSARTSCRATSIRTSASVSRRVTCNACGSFSRC